MKYSFEVNRFDGGLNNKATPQTCDPNQSPDLYDVTFDDLGAVQTRAGYTSLNSVQIATSYPVVGLHSYTPASGDSQLIAACAGSFWRCTGAATTPAAIASSLSQFTTTAPMYMMSYQDILYACNGVESGYKYNGTEFTRWGVPTCSAATLAADSAGTLTGEYHYRIAGVNSYSVQGNYGSATTLVTLASLGGYVTEIPVFPVSAGVIYKLVCRNTAAASGVYYVVTQIANATTVYQDNNSDSTLVTLAPTDNGLPASFFAFCHLKGVTFGIKKTSSYLYYSNIDEPETWGATDFIKIADGDGMYCKGIAVLADGIVICKNDTKSAGKVFYLYVPDNGGLTLAEWQLNWSLQELDSEHGSESAKVMARFSNYIMMMNRFGIFDLSQVSPGLIRPDALSWQIEPTMLAMAQAYIYRASAIAWKNKVWISVPYGSTATYNNKILQYDYVRGRAVNTRDVGAWSIFSGPGVEDFTIHNNNLYAGSSTLGTIWQLDTGTSDGTSAINGYYKTFSIQGNKGHENKTKVWRHLWILVEASGDWQLKIEQFLDFDSNSNEYYEVDLDPDFAYTWDDASWDTFTWDKTVERKVIKVTLTNAVSKWLQLKFSTNTADKYFKLHNIKAEYILKGER